MTNYKKEWKIKTETTYHLKTVDQRSFEDADYRFTAMRANLQSVLLRAFNNSVTPTFDNDN